MTEASREIFKSLWIIFSYLESKRLGMGGQYISETFSFTHADYWNFPQRCPNQRRNEFYTLRMHYGQFGYFIKKLQ